MTVTQPEELLSGIYAFPVTFPNSAGTGFKYLITHPEGNVLFGIPGNLADHIDAITALGGVRYCFIQEGVPSTELLKLVKDRFGAKLICHRVLVYDLFKKLGAEPDVVYRKDLDITPDCRAVWTPGHATDCACLVVNRGKGVLVSGDTMILDEHGRPYTIFPKHHLETQRESLKRLAAYDFDAVLPVYAKGAVHRCLQGGKAMLTNFLAAFPAPGELDAELFDRPESSELIMYMYVHGAALPGMGTGLGTYVIDREPREFAINHQREVLSSLRNKE